MLAQMQNHPLLLSAVLDHADREHGSRVVTSRYGDGATIRRTYAELARRARRLAAALLEMGVGVGDRVSTLAWNTDRHLELYFAITGIGAICHTVNPRLHPSQVAYILRDAGSRWLFADVDLCPLAEIAVADCPDVSTVVALCAGDQTPAWTGRDVAFVAYEALIDGAEPLAEWPVLDERLAAVLCYTSGTTGAPKGVAYSHRSIVLHAYAAAAPDVLGYRAVDVVMPVVPMFHVMAWGIPFVAAMAGSALVLPGHRLDGGALHELMQAEGVTVSAAVPTVWLSLLDAMDKQGAAPGALSRVLNGGAALPQRIVKAFRERYGIQVQHAWGMTECSPIAGVNSPKPGQALFPDPAYDATQARQGRAPFGIRVEVFDEGGAILPRDGQSVGHVRLKGHWVLDAYFGAGAGTGTRATDDGGWFDAGDLGVIDDNGFLLITDRAKDAIKSGGEWISTIELENIALSHDAVAEAAVIGRPDPVWDERPLLIVALKSGQSATEGELLDIYRDRVARWMVPDAVAYVDALPKGATGKIDKQALRATFVAQG